jgi:hypothetical protein
VLLLNIGVLILMQQYKDLDTQRERYRETNDCTVKAQAAAFNISYGKAHRQMAKAGRRNRQGANILVMSKAVALQTGEEMKEVLKVFLKPPKRVTIGRFCKENPKGTFIITSASHAMCVRDGVLIDWTAEGPQRRIVTNVYKVA